MTPEVHAVVESVRCAARGTLLVAAALATLAACTGGTASDAGTASSPAATTATTSRAPETDPPTATVTPTPSPTPTPTPTPTPLVADPSRAMADVVALAGLGPREGTSEAFQEAAAFVEARFTELGYDVRRQDFDAPAGVSWGVPVPAGTSTNVIAALPDTDLTDAHVVVGAHLDTVPQAPGAEDNASGVASMLEVARLAAATPPEVPVVFVAFGAEEPRGEPTADHSYHHFGSTAYVAAMGEAQRAALVGGISLDRVGVGDTMPIGWAGIGPTTLRDALVAGAQAAGVPHVVDQPRTTSDHLSFELAGLVSARLGHTPYDGYHSPADVASVVNAEQLGRAVVITWTTLQALRAS